MGTQDQWSHMSDDEVFAELEKLDDYNDAGQKSLIAEAKRRKEPRQDDPAGGNSQDQKWVCPKCFEESEANFDSCWSCGTSRDGSAPSPEPSAGPVAKPSPTPSRLPQSSSNRKSSAKFEYKAVPFSAELKSGIGGSIEDVREVSKQLESIFNRHASQGWELVAISPVNIAVKPGCVAGLFGGRETSLAMDQVVFKRPIG